MFSSPAIDLFVSHVFCCTVNLASYCHVALSPWHVTHLAKTSILAWVLWEETINVKTWAQFSGGMGHLVAKIQ